MVTLSISPKLVKQEKLVIIAKREYDDLLRRANFAPQKTNKKLPSWLKASLRDVKEGRISGPFNTVKELMAHLEK